MKIALLVVLLCICAENLNAEEGKGIRLTAFSASSEDCAVIAAIGDNQIKWREHAIPTSLSMDAGSFGTDCDWDGMGVSHFPIVETKPGEFYSGVHFSFTKPVYSSDGTEATSDYDLKGNAGPREYFFSEAHCSAKKNQDGWRFYKCIPGRAT